MVGEGTRLITIAWIIEYLNAQTTGNLSGTMGSCSTRDRFRNKNSCKPDQPGFLDDAASAVSLRRSPVSSCGAS